MQETRYIGTCNWCGRSITSDQKWKPFYRRDTASVITGYATVTLYHVGPCPT